MTRDLRVRVKGRRSGHTFVALPHHILVSREYASLSAGAVKLLVDMLAFYNGRNNGALAAAWTMMRARGWRSPGALQRARDELLASGFIIATSMGDWQRRKPRLYAVSFIQIHECSDVELDIAATTVPPNSWIREPYRTDTESVHGATPGEAE